MVMYTVDVYSGSADSIIKDPHAQGVIIKATQGTGYVNPKCNHQRDLTASLGKKLGFYHYAGGGDPVKEAQYFIGNIKNYIGTGILILDWEAYQNSAFGDKTWCRKFVEEVHRLTGVWPGIYASESALGQVASCADVCALWVAKYASMQWNSWTVPNMNVSSGAFKFITGWQYTGGDMDRSIWFLDATAWDKLAKPNVENPTPITQPKVNPKKPVIETKTWTDALGDVWHSEDGKFTSTTALHLRWGARTTSATVALLPAGSVVKYDAWSRHGGYVWLRQPRGEKQYAYVVCRNAYTNEAYGKFE